MLDQSIPRGPAGPLCVSRWVTAVLALALAAGARATVSGCAILQYHHVAEDTPALTSVTPARFEAHLDYLAGQGFEVLALGELLRRLQSGEDLPRRCVSLTFDDAYANFASEAAPRLRARGWPATVFVPTDGVARLPGTYLSWAQMRSLQEQGFVFANHSASHDHLVRRREGEDEAAWRQRVRADIQRAQRRLEQELGPTPRWFVYPYGEYDQALRALVGELGYIGLGQQSGAVGTHSDPRALPRFPLAGRYAEPGPFAERALSLPLPVTGVRPDQPLLPVGESQPRLELELDPAVSLRNGLACYAGAERLELNWSGEYRVWVQASTPLPVGRSRYNCTAPAAEPGRYYWFSQPWIRRHDDGSWYAEP